MNEVIEYFDKEDGINVFTETTAIAICSKCDQSLTLEDHIDWDVVAHWQCTTNKREKKIMNKWMHCTECGGDNIALVNAICLWDVDKQLWMYDDGGEVYCKSCGEFTDIKILEGEK